MMILGTKKGKHFIWGMVLKGLTRAKSVVKTSIWSPGMQMETKGKPVVKVRFGKTELRSRIKCLKIGTKKK